MTSDLRRKELETTFPPLQLYSPPPKKGSSREAFRPDLWIYVSGFVDRKLQLWILEVLVQNVRVHHNAVPLAQEVKRGQSVLRDERRNM